MKKNAALTMKCAVCITILLGVLLILFANEQSFSKIVSNDIENISKLSSSIIYAEIDNNLTKPIFVGQTMANDQFLKNWLSMESTMGGTAAQAALMQRFLANYSTKYGYDSVFVVSEKSHIYYYQEGINKVISPQDAHDVWYYDFAASKKTYDLDVDWDEVNSRQLTIFVNCRMEDSSGAFLGVVGVGVKMSHLQELLGTYEQAYDLKAFLINPEGLVQVDTVSDNIEVANFFEAEEHAALKTQILENTESMETFWYPEGGVRHCLITKYVENLDWYIVIEKNNAKVQQMFAAQINQSLFLIAVIMVVVLLLISYVLSMYNRMLLQTNSIDDVTNLPNVRMFQEIFKRNAKRSGCHAGVAFMFDIDDFKNINDCFGHMVGNTVLYRVSETARDTIGTKGCIARWGGDEFAGMIYATPKEAEEILRQICNNIRAISDVPGVAVSVSLGATKMVPGSSLDAMLREADTAMYRAKDNGKNQISFFE